MWFVSPPKRHHCNKHSWTDEGSKATLYYCTLYLVLRSCINTITNSPSSCTASPGETTIRDLLHCSTALNLLTFSPGSHGTTLQKELVGENRSPLVEGRSADMLGRGHPPLFVPIKEVSPQISGLVIHKCTHRSQS